MNYDLIDNVEVEDIKTWDYPDFCDAFIAYAEYDGVPMTEKQLDEINDDRDFVYSQVEKKLY